MADEDATTPEQAIEGIRKAMIRVEEQYPDSHAVKVLHRRLEKGLNDHGHLLGFDQNQIVLLAGGGTPKTPGGGKP